jgi:hemoglobin/transferrin/lactoferrin receptor protein
VLGVGAERALNDRWSLRAEYNYANFGRETFEYEDARAGVGLAYAFNGFVRDPVTGERVRVSKSGPGTVNIVEGRKVRSDADLHMVRVGLSYRF